MRTAVPIDEQALTLYRNKLAQTGREAIVERIAIVMCARPEIWAEMDWPPVVEIACQIPLANSRADIVLKHDDGSVSVIEVKPARLSLREYCTGIGQLAYQSTLAAFAYRTRNVRQILCMPGPIPFDLVLATYHSPIRFLPLPFVDEWSGWIAENKRSQADAYPFQSAP